ncbi:exopolysaccharide synthesis protein (plasmid) [Rhizobium leguminosarum]|nr:exopolysaccharide synthesis protein [Rhizobium leguminosarum]
MLWGLLIPVLLLAGIVVFYREIHHLEDPVGLYEYRAVNKAARSSRIAARPDPVAPSPLPPTSISLQLIEVPKLELASQFLRMWRVSGPNICGALREAGIEMSEWKAASMRNRSYECYFQRIYERDEVRPLSSTFLKVRGNEMGDILEIRAKIIGPTTDIQGRLAPAILRIFEIIVKQACWRDFEDTLASIQNLRNVEYERFGSYLSFTREGSGNNFNFVLGLKATSSSQVRTRTYFSTERWLATTDPRNVPANFIRMDRLSPSISANCAQ